MAKTICLFNHKGGVSKTTTTFNLGWSLAEYGKKVLIVDLDSQCNLTGLVLGYAATGDDQMSAFYSNREILTMQPIVASLISGTQPDEFIRNEQGKPFPTLHENLFLLPGHLETSEIDAQISVALKVATGIPAMKNIPGNLPTMLIKIAEKYEFDYVIYDLSPNVGGLNEIILMSSDYFIVPTSPDFFCLQAVTSLQKHIVKWHQELARFIEDNGFSASYSVKNHPLFLGAIQQRYRPRYGNPAKSFQKWIDIIRDAINSKLVPELQRIDCVIARNKLEEILKDSGLAPYDLAHIADFNSLIAMSQQLSKPIFALTDEDIQKTGSVIGIVKENMIESRNKFQEAFTGLTQRILQLTR